LSRILKIDPMGIISDTVKLAERLGDEAYFVAVCARSGMVGSVRPDRVLRMGLAFERFGLLGAALAAAAIRDPDETAVIDEHGRLSFKQLDRRANALANAWRREGLEPGEGVAILARNHHGFVEAVFAAARCGARIVLLNTSFAGPQIREVAAREGTDLLVYDDEYAEELEGLRPRRGRWRAWTDEPGEDTLEALIESSSTDPPPKAGVPPRIIILTSGTTGTPKGAPRPEPRSLSPIGGILSKVPFRSGEVTELCAPMFHALGFAHAIIAIAVGDTLVLRRHFDPAATLDSLERHRASAMILVPVMLKRILGLGDEAILDRDLAGLRIIFVSGSQLGTELAEHAINVFGPVVYNLYGSTEVAYATIATPEDLRVEPASVGKVVRGTVVKILDEDNRELPVGATGRVFVANTVQVEGYTGGGAKEQVNGLMSSGDIGHFDKHGRLFIDGRDDEMIISGGENVFPHEVEDLLTKHEAIEEAAAIGVEDRDFGQRLRAFVVLRDGATMTEDEVKGYVKQNLAGFKTPRDVVFVDVLPRNATGKVLKRELMQHDAAT